MNSSIFKILFVLIAYSLFWGQSLAQDSAVRTSVKKTVDALRVENQLHIGSPVGVAGIPETKNTYYKLFLKLKRNATNAELLQLIQDSSSVIKLYSYMALVERGDINVKNIFLSHIYNTTEVWAAGGCTGVVWKLNQFMLFYIRPDVPGSVSYLSKTEFDTYCKSIGLKLY